MNKILSKEWVGTVVWIIGILLVVGVGGFYWLKYAKNSKKRHTASIPLGPSMEELCMQYRTLEQKKQYVLNQYAQRQKTELDVRKQWDHINNIENIFYREFGLVERMAEIQKCLSMETYTGTVEASVIYTQLTNMARAIQQFEDKKNDSASLNAQELYIPGWFAMEETKKSLVLAESSEQLEKKKRYQQQMETVEQALEKQLIQWQATAIPKPPEAEAVQRWEQHLADVKHMVGNPEAMNKMQQLEAARSLAEYAAKYFKDRL